MTDIRFDAVLDINDPDFANQLREAIGAKPGEPVQFITPQFDRTDGIQPVVANFNFSNLPSYPAATLRALGCCPWDEPDENGETLWLYPAEWYDRIPEGHVVTTINGEEEPFQPGVTDNDKRFGVLAYGFVRREAAPPPPAKAPLTVEEVARIIGEADVQYVEENGTPKSADEDATWRAFLAQAILAAMGRANALSKLAASDADLIDIEARPNPPSQEGTG